MSAEIAAGRIQRLPAGQFLHQLLGPLALHLLSGPLIARHVRPEESDLDKACATFAAGFVQAVGKPEPAAPAPARRTGLPIETKGDRSRHRLLRAAPAVVELLRPEQRGLGGEPRGPSAS